MGFKTDLKNNLAEFEVSDEFTIYHLSSAKDELVKILDKCSGVKLDFKNVSRIDSAGIQFLISLVKTCTRRNISIEIINKEAFYNAACLPRENLKSFFS
ncbi:MAG: STAS domain-containing protein [Thermodesulfobacteriota bacterium]